MAEIFDFDVQASPTATVSFATLDAQFGDGYSQSAADGINNKAQSWSIRIRGLKGADCVPSVDMQAAYEFLDAHGGWKSFQWTTPEGYTGLFLCKNYGWQKDGDVRTLNGNFVEVFR
jgi:phage-related protein